MGTADATDIAGFPAVAELDAAQIADLRVDCDERTLKAGETLICHRTAGGTLYFVLSGTVQVYVATSGRDIELAELPAPVVVGELELLTGRPRTASVRALTDVRAMAISHERVLARIDAGDPAVLKVMFAIGKMVASRLVAVTEKFVEIERNVTAPHTNELRAFRAKLFSEWS